jgi:hypothetical protein
VFGDRRNIFYGETRDREGIQFHISAKEKFV